MRKIAILVIIFAISPTTHAAFFDLNLGLLQGGFNSSTDSKISRSFNSFGLYAHLGKPEARNGFLLGWNMTTVSNKDEFTGSVDQTVTSSDMGPAIRWYYDRDVIYSSTLVYGVICKGNFKNATVDEKISGDSLTIKLSAETKVSEHIFIGFSLNSYTANYKSAVSNSVQTDVSYKNSWLYPSLSLAVQF